MWKEDSQGRALWPRGYLEAVKPSAMRNLKDIKRGLQGFINHWDKLSEEDLLATIGDMNLLATIGGA